MLEQYWALKREVPDAILLYRLGDFYEMFFEDAEAAAPLLGLVLTARHRDTDIEAPMCGVPHHALESYVARLVGGRPEGGDRRADRGAPEGEDPRRPRRSSASSRPGRSSTRSGSTPGRRTTSRRSSSGADAPALAYLDLSTGDFSVIRLDGTPPGEMLSRRTGEGARRLPVRAGGGGPPARTPRLRCPGPVGPRLRVAARPERGRPPRGALPHLHARRLRSSPRRARSSTPPRPSSPTPARRRRPTAPTSPPSGPSRPARASSSTP